MKKDKLPDVQKTKMKSIKLNRVGVKDVDFPIYIKTKKGNKVLCAAKVDMYVSLTRTIKGINMSRLPRALMKYRYTSFSRWVLWKFLYDLKKFSQTSDAYAEFKFKYFVNKIAPVTKEPSVMGYDCAFIGHISENGYTFHMRVKVIGTSNCPCCFLPDTPIFLQNEIKSIKNVKGGNTLENGKIKKTFYYPSIGKKYVEIKVQGILPIKCSSDHEILTKKSGWVNANCLTKQDYVIIPKQKQNSKFPQNLDISNYFKNFRKMKNNKIKNTIKITKNLGRLCGLFIAEGSIGKSYITFSFNQNEKILIKFVQKEIENSFGVKPRVYHNIKNSTISIYLNRSSLVDFFKDHFGKNTLNRKVPLFILNSPSKIIKEFIRGWYEGDGSHTTYRKTQRITTTSKLAAMQLQLLFLKLNKFMSITISKAKNSKAITKNNTKALIHDQYCCLLSPQLLYTIGINSEKPHHKNNRIFEDSNNFYIPITYIKKINYVGRVYDLQTSKSRYTIPFLVHNSKEISKFGAHGQRSIVSATIETKHKRTMWIEDLIKLLENNMSCEIYPVLKRPDEKYVTEKAYQQPRFVEDTARGVALDLQTSGIVKWYKVRVINKESIHTHDAVSYICRKLKGKQWVNAMKGLRKV